MPRPHWGRGCALYVPLAGDAELIVVLSDYGLLSILAVDATDAGVYSLQATLKLLHRSPYITPSMTVSS